MSVTYANILQGRVDISIGTSGKLPIASEEIGRTTDSGVDMIDTSERSDIPVYDDLDYGTRNTKPGRNYAFTLGEYSEADAARALEYFDNHGSINASGSTREKYVSVLGILETVADTEYKYWWLPWAACIDAATITAKTSAKLMVPYTFKAHRRAATPPAVMEFGVRVVTIATSVAAMSTGFNAYRLAGEDDAADTVATMTGGASGDWLLLMADDADNAITLTDDGDTGTADAFYMDTGAAGDVVLAGGDMILFVRNATQWVESWRCLTT